MAILHDIEQFIARIEDHIAHIIALRAQYVKEEGNEALSEVNNKISGLKAWLDDIKAAIVAEHTH